MSMVVEHLPKMDRHTIGVTGRGGVNNSLYLHMSPS